MQAPRQQSEGPVLIVRGLHPYKVNADGLFNLLCLYGNVEKVKFLAGEPGSALVQMADSLGAERAAKLLHSAEFFGSVVQVYRTTLDSADSSEPLFRLADGTESLKHYAYSDYNRFSTSADAARNHIRPPSRWLHFFNAPAKIISYDIRGLLSLLGCSAPESITVFASKTGFTTSGLIQFETASAAVEAVVACNHVRLVDDCGSAGLVLKLNFFPRKH
ncbi:heterogeneous nuclear ribonucleoprotein L-like [Haemaphysalis longicornis]